jgi:hypothetical protein
MKTLLLCAVLVLTVCASAPAVRADGQSMPVYDPTAYHPMRLAPGTMGYEYEMQRQRREQEPKPMTDPLKLAQALKSCEKFDPPSDFRWKCELRARQLTSQ